MTSSEPPDGLPGQADSVRPQGATTGRWEIVANLGKQGAARQWKRWNDVPMWYRVLDRFGFPTLFALVLLWGGYRLGTHALEIWEGAQTRTIQVLDRLVDKVDQLDKTVRDRRGP